MSLEARVAALEGKAVTIEASLAENTKLTKEVLDTLRAFKMIGAIAKYGTVVGGALVGAYHGADAIVKHLIHR